jgi:hypothetical protein
MMAFTTPGLLLMFLIHFELEKEYSVEYNNQSLVVNDTVFITYCSFDKENLVLRNK